MLTRQEAHHRSQITFTSDFHELVNGNLKPGTSLRLSYDPQRIVPEGEQYTFGDPQRPITAYARFDTQSPWVSVVLTSAGMSSAPDRDPTGQGSMLKAKLDIPSEAQMLSIWFSFTCLDGSLVYDSDFGTNFNFRFPEHDLDDLETNVTSDTIRHVSLFYVRVATISTVDHVSVRFCPVGTPRANSNELPLHLAGSTDGYQKKQWSTDEIVIPTGAVISFKLYYWIAGIRYKDDNTGHYYLSPPRPAEHVPPPPPELALAARNWK